MSIAVVLVGLLLGVLLGLAAGVWLPPHGRRPKRNRPESARRILLPVTGPAISRRALEAAVRLARTENAVVMPAFLARVPMSLPLETALPVQSARGMPLLEAIEQRITEEGLPVDSRIGRGRSFRHALQRLLEEEHFDRIIVSAEQNPRTGLRYDDLRWLLHHAPAEVLILRPAPQDTRRVSAEGVSGHF